MGQAHLLLIVLVVIVVGLAVIVGIEMFGASAAAANLDAVVHDLLNLALRAQQYYIKPKVLGGGSLNFRNITIQDMTLRPVNANGSYSVVETASRWVLVQGDGNQDGDDDGQNLRVTAKVSPDTVVINILNR